MPFNTLRIVMKTKIKFALLLLTIIFSGLNQTLMAQSHFKIGTSKVNEMKISGTSTFHDWTMKTAVFSGKATFNIGAENHITKLSAIAFNLPVQMAADEIKAN